MPASPVSTTSCSCTPGALLPGRLQPLQLAFTADKGGFACSTAGRGHGVSAAARPLRRCRFAGGLRLPEQLLQLGAWHRVQIFAQGSQSGLISPQCGVLVSL